MPKFTFICEHRYSSPSKTTVEFDGETLTDVLEHFEYFLQGSGYRFTGVLDFVNDEEPKVDVPEFEFDKSDWPFPEAESQEIVLHDYGAAQAAQDINLDTSDTITVTIK